jgi:hypothetical protein
VFIRKPFWTWFLIHNDNRIWSWLHKVAVTEGSVPTVQVAFPGGLLSFSAGPPREGGSQALRHICSLACMHVGICVCIKQVCTHVSNQAGMSMATPNRILRILYEIIFLALKRQSVWKLHWNGTIRTVWSWGFETCLQNFSTISVNESATQNIRQHLFLQPVGGGGRYDEIDCSRQLCCRWVRGGPR